VGVVVMAVVLAMIVEAVRLVGDVARMVQLGGVVAGLVGHRVGLTSVR
jgi:hypothetical protein